ncbi:uncharacterized protein MYCFIDRAFT_83918 [Pseudocercospora fijiensis CIRAD86]|uniref:Uncharacterized protein n=1 Tax=Pseudocercospora fijiensis (strain CIRAD86) TaxID=383855 RepID=N1Q9H8_PSEFD|nr:uncharacterized protein MYCFIDRAFT_83918 [Pseudocercospora fijiensis CIRAD86]EME88451.1 hypothetical protein MYCFIDRAFT_83918 [Pseudocercospora fijiensis CIRAD86]
MDTETPHVLNFHYPACELLPASAQFPILEVPKDVAYRDQPPQDHQLRDAFSTNFYVLLPPETRQQRLVTPDSHTGLITAVENLCTVQGSSSLRFVAAFDSSKGAVVWRYLVTYHSGAMEFKQRFELTSVQQAVLLRLAGTYKWIRMLEHLICRESDMAFYHVWDNLQKAYPDADLEAEALDWDAEWASAIKRTPGDLLNDRLASSNTFVDLSGKGVVKAVLPCGHISPINLAGLKIMTANECLASKCFCDSEILTDQDMREIAIKHEIDVCRANFLKRNLLWKKLDICINKQSVVTFTHSTILLALDATLDSLKAPKSIIPRSMCFANSYHARKLATRFKLRFNGPSQPEASTVGDLLAFLLDEATSALGGDEGLHLLPPGIAAFVRQWIKRAVNFLDLCRCDQQGKDHNALHQHGERFFYRCSGQQSNQESIDELLEKMDLAGGVTSKAENLHELFGDMMMNAGTNVAE